jgi:hypothetical protein
MTMSKQTITTDEARRLANVTRQCLNAWLHRFEGLGLFVGGRWRVDPEVLGRLLAGERLPRRKSP